MSKFWLASATTLVVALALGAVIVALVSAHRGVELVPANSPEGTVQRYLLALEKEDYEAAYQYLSQEMRGRCPLDQFVTRNYWRISREDSVTLVKSESFGDRALVRATVMSVDDDAPFGVSNEYDRAYQLKLESGQWRLAESNGWCGPY